MFRSRIARLVAIAAAALAFGTACTSTGVDGSGSTDPGTSTSTAASADQSLDAAAKLLADALAPQMQTLLTNAGFTGVKVTSEMDEGTAVITADVSLTQLKSVCKLNYESKVTDLKVYFDEVITPQKPEGVEVKGAARDTVSPKSAFGYMLKNHPDCLVPNAKAPTK